MCNFVLNTKNELVQVYLDQDQKITDLLYQNQKIKRLYSYSNNVHICKYIDPNILVLPNNIEFKLGINIQKSEISFSLFQVAQLYPKSKYSKLFSGLVYLDQSIYDRIKNKKYYKNSRRYRKNQKIKKEEQEIQIQKHNNIKEKIITNYYVEACDSILNLIYKFIPKKKLTIHFYRHKYNQLVYNKLNNKYNKIIPVHKRSIALANQKIKKIPLKSDTLIFCNDKIFTKNYYEDNWQIQDNNYQIKFRKFKKHIRNFAFKYRDRNYYLKHNNKIQIIAKNRNKKNGQVQNSIAEILPIIDKHINQIKQQYSKEKSKKLIEDFQLIVKPGMISQRKPNKNILYHPGDIIEYNGYQRICHFWDSGSRKLKLIGTEQKINQNQCKLIRHNPGLVCLDNYY